MATHEPSGLLKNWQACLAVAQQRMADQSFGLEIHQSLESEFGSFSLAGRASGLSVCVMDTGRDLVKLGMRLECTLEDEEKTVHVENGAWEIITSFQTIQDGGSHEVRPNLADPDLSVTFSAGGLDTEDEAAIETILNRWIAGRIASNPFLLFTFTADTGHGAGARFTEFEVTTAYAKYSPEYSSFLLLMRESGGEAEENELVIDPHVLPQGQTAVLWVGHGLLEKAGGASLVRAAELELGFRPRPMGVDIPHVSEELRRWSGTIIDSVSLPGGLEFTSMQMSPPGLMLSATPLSLGELDAFTACDVTARPANPVQHKAEELFQDCVLFYMKERYRTHLLQKNRPVLPKEVREVTEPWSRWFEKFARLQLARAIRESDAKWDDPFSRFDDKKIDAMLRKMSLSDTYADLTGKLYALAFCLVHPRISLYMEDPDRWKPLYCSYLTSEAYADALMADKQPISKIHDDNAKLTVFDLSGTTSKETLPRTLAAFMGRVADCKWKPFVKERPDNYRAVLEDLLGAIAKEIDNTLASGTATGESSTSREAVEAGRMKKAMEGAGGVAALAGALTTILSDEARQDNDVPLADVISRAAHKANDGPACLGSCLSFAASAAVRVVLLLEIRKDLSGDADETTRATYIREFTEGFVPLSTAGGTDIGKMLKDKLGRILVTSLKFATWLTKTVIAKIAGGVTCLVHSVKAIAGICGRALAYAAAALSIFDAVNDFKGGNIGAGVLDVMLAAVALLGVLSIALSWTGPLAWALTAVGVILALVRFLCFKDESESEKTAGELARELAADGVTM
jgi:hypothetical protein